MQTGTHQCQLLLKLFHLLAFQLLKLRFTTCVLFFLRKLCGLSLLADSTQSKQRRAANSAIWVADLDVWRDASVTRGVCTNSYAAHVRFYDMHAQVSIRTVRA